MTSVFAGKAKRFRARGYEHAFQQVMDGGTPKKIVDSDSKCFTCSSPSANAEKIYIFGKSSIDVQGIIKSSLNVDVSCFANSGKIFVCKSCYKRLTKFQRSSEKLNKIRQKIEEAFKKRDVPRTKRLQRASEDLHGNIPEGNHQDQVRDMSRTQESLSRQKVSKSLQFGTGQATTCTSSANSSYQDFSSWKQPVPAYLPGFLSPIQSQPSLLLSAFPNQNMASPRSAHAFLPGVTSTPRTSDVQEKSQVQLKIQYPSKNVNKSLTGSYQSTGKALAHGVPSQIAGAVMNCHSVRKHIVEKVLKIVNKEVAELCSTRKPSILRKIEKEDLEKFDLQLVCDEWREQAPVFYSFLLTSAINKRTKSFGWFGSLAIAGSILLKQRNKDISAAASVIGILLKSKSVEV